jgi:hypothetical protein
MEKKKVPFSLQYQIREYLEYFLRESSSQDAE